MYHRFSFRMSRCSLTETCCYTLGSVLGSNSSPLRELDVSNNDLQDSGMKMLSAGLGNPHCKLEILSFTEEGCASLASALRSNPSHLREVDLSFNHLGDSGVKLLSARLADPYCRLDKLNLNQNEELWFKPELLKKYATEVTLDPNTQNKFFSLIEENRKLTWVDEEQTYPDNPQRFEEMPQVLCRAPLTKRHYWEADLIGNCDIVAYKCISRWGKATDCKLGANDRSWCMFFEEKNRYLACHNNKENHILYPTTRPDPQREGVYLDWPDGTLSFYSVSSDTMTRLYTFQAKFTEPFYPAFGVTDTLMDSSVSLAVTSSPVPAENPA
ncbi:neoverrucotoxin subunit alpha-like isoform X1 [Oncorhynchus keta]|uniref:neoverrucotoxin subunit alpha-like isoform X1 n=2 Tax=Oncorhynchus keta TaxID=8018 RepID=UPI0015F885F5|nr:neoverrucotoxin subunit alpha-like isoform X1 [Oncorhynchus keta]